VQLYIEKMECNGCVRSVTATIKELDSNAVIDIDLPQKTVTIQSTQPVDAITLALEEAGFSAQVR